jgi:hypothetical protein
MYKKQKGLAMNSGNSLKVYIVENKIDSLSMMATVVEKKRGSINVGNLH